MRSHIKQSRRAALCLSAISTMLLKSMPGASTQVGAGPVPLERHAGVPAPQDRAFVGIISLLVDATDTTRSIFTVTETVPVQAPGDMVLLYPEWETGSHAPTASLIGLAGLFASIDGHPAAWYRDPVDMHAFHVTVPDGAHAVNLTFQFLSPPSAAWLRPEMVDVQWHRLLLYPAGWFARDLPVAASLRLPEGMQAFTSLAPAAATSSVLHFAPVPLDRLADAPVYASRAWRERTLTSSGSTPVRLDLLADDPADLAIDDAEAARLAALVTQTMRVFGPPPFRHYDMLLSLSDLLSPGGGIEHLEEGENNLPARYLRDLEHQLNNRDLVAHELVHAWNGRFRQPEDLWTPNFNQPAGASLLWVYEGQTEFWGRVLAARSGLRSTQQTLDKLALDAALVSNRPGRRWKSLSDSTNDAIYMAGHSVAWRDWQRREDYYPEGVLLWLDVGARLRQLTDGRRGLDDFAARFFRSGAPTGIVSTYSFEDVCRALDAIAHADWRRFLALHLETHADDDALAGLARAGWRLVYRATPSATFLQEEAEAGDRNFSYSIGATVDEGGKIDAVSWGGPADQVDIVAGARIKSVNTEAFTMPILLHAVSNASTQPIRLGMVFRGNAKLVALSYGSGARYPWLERMDDTPDRLTPLFTAR